MILIATAALTLALIVAIGTVIYVGWHIKPSANESAVERTVI